MTVHAAAAPRWDRTRAINVVAVALPLAAVVAAGALAWNEVLGPADLAVFAGMYVLANFLGIDIGFHRLLTHRSFETSRPARAAFAVLGTMALQGPVINWVADHRKHHAFADQDGDPHSPHTEGGTGVLGTLRGLWHAHVGWLLDGSYSSEPVRYARDLVRDPAMLRISRWALPIVAVGLVLPFGAGLLIGGSVGAGLTALLWGGPVRIFVGNHGSWAINSICHRFGQRRFDIPDESRNVPILAIPSLGASWHHNHHAFPTSARHGLRWFEFDLAGLAIGGMGRVGLAWNVVRITPEQQRAKEVGA